MESSPTVHSVRDPVPGDNPQGPGENPLTADLVAFDEPEPEGIATAEAQSRRSVALVDVAASLSLPFTYANGAVGTNLMMEAIGGGSAWLDYDLDGAWDLYCCQGGSPIGERDPAQPNDRLFRGRGDGFADATDLVGIDERRYGQGVAAADYDGDGFDDVYVTNCGANSLFRNQGDGTFVELAATAGVADPRWSSSVAWFDLDLDGDLDLYVCNYADYDAFHPRPCTDEHGVPRICHPNQVPDIPDECYFNQGDGTFTAEARSRGLSGEGNRALGVVAGDFNNDDLPDLYVANDTTANFLFVNQGGAQFDDRAIALGCAVDRNGAAQASMGLACGDYDRSGWLDLYSTHFRLDSNTLYRNLGPHGFEDVTAKLDLHQPTFEYLGFGTVMVDFNQDGLQELFVANGHIDPENKPYEMNAQLFGYNGRTFDELTAEAGEYFQRKVVGRGVATCDYDRDGDVDLAVVHQNSPVALLRNDSPRGHWLQLRFLGRLSNRRAIGTRVTVVAGEQRWMQELCGGTSYASSHEPALTFGLGDVAGPVTLEVRWPRGLRQTLENVALDQSLTLREPPAPDESPLAAAVR